MVTTFHHDIGIPTGVGARQAQRRHDRLGAGIRVADQLGGWNHLADALGNRQLNLGRKREYAADGQGFAHGLVDPFVGIAEDWRPYSGSDELAKIPDVEIMPLDVTDTISVNELAGEIGGKTDILVNTAEHVRPGAAMQRQGILTARDEMETNYFGLMRLIQAFGPGLRGRGADGDNSACAWVNLLSVYALSNWSVYGTTTASQAAAYSLSQCLRGEFAGSGVKVVNVLFGPLEESWRQPLPPPKVTPKRLADTIVDALRQGIENVTLGPVAEDIVRRFKDDPFVLERELTQAQQGQAV